MIIMKIITDLHLHSKYSRAVSQEMTIYNIWQWARKKGIDLAATGDWTHPLWFREIRQNLEEVGNGLLKIKDERNGPFFLLSTELSSIYSQSGKTRRIHLVVWISSFKSAEKINQALISRGANLISDGRPILGLTSQELMELILTIDSKSLIIPAHIWTPWFSLYGSESGFDSLEECFGRFSKYIYAVETGLSSDPAMNWRIKELDSRAIVSYSDAHSGPKLGREATVFEVDELCFEAIRQAVMNNQADSQVVNSKYQASNMNKNQNIANTKYIIPNTISYTIEFYPEEGKYHWSGHRNCGVKQNPAETAKKGTICPVCGKKLTLGVMHRVEELAKRTVEELSVSSCQLPGVMGGTKCIKSETLPSRPPYIMLVPLQEIIAEAFETTPTTQTVQNEYKKLTDKLGSEFAVLLNSSISDILAISGEKVARAIDKVRKGDIVVDPGYDGVFGVVKIWPVVSKASEEKKGKEQMSLF